MNVRHNMKVNRRPWTRSTKRTDSFNMSVGCFLLLLFLCRVFFVYLFFREGVHWFLGTLIAFLKMRCSKIEIKERMFPSKKILNLTPFYVFRLLA